MYIRARHSSAFSAKERRRLALDFGEPNKFYPSIAGYKEFNLFDKQCRSPYNYTMSYQPSERFYSSDAGGQNYRSENKLRLFAYVLRLLAYVWRPKKFGPSPVTLGTIVSANQSHRIIRLSMTAITLLNQSAQKGAERRCGYSYDWSDCAAHVDVDRQLARPSRSRSPSAVPTNPASRPARRPAGLRHSFGRLPRPPLRRPSPPEHPWRPALNGVKPHRRADPTCGCSGKMRESSAGRMVGSGPARLEFSSDAVPSGRIKPANRSGGEVGRAESRPPRPPGPRPAPSGPARARRSR